MWTSYIYEEANSLHVLSAVVRQGYKCLWVLDYPLLFPGHAPVYERIIRSVRQNQNVKLCYLVSELAEQKGEMHIEERG